MSVLTSGFPPITSTSDARPRSTLHQDEYPHETRGILPFGGPRTGMRCSCLKYRIGRRRRNRHCTGPSQGKDPCRASSWQPAHHGGQAPEVSHSMASLCDVKKRVGQGGTCTPRKKFARTRSTGDLPNRAMREAPQGMDQTLLASRLTERTAAISTSMGWCSCWQTWFTFAIAARASSTSIWTPGSQRRWTRPPFSNCTLAFPPSTATGSTRTSSPAQAAEPFSNSSKVPLVPRLLSYNQARRTSHGLVVKSGNYDLTLVAAWGRPSGRDDRRRPSRRYSGVRGPW